MGTMYKPAPEVREIADALMISVPGHKLLAEVRVEYVFRDKAPVSKGRYVLGRARKIGGLNAFTARKSKVQSLQEPDPFFVIEISENTWNILDESQRIALVDHELMHCVVFENADGEYELSTRGHDFEEFADIVRRHGLWCTGDISMAAAVAEQLALAIDDATAFVANAANPDPDDIDEAADEDGDE